MADAARSPDSPFAKVETQNVDFPALERAVLAFWDEQGVFEKRKALNAGKPPWSFLDGPITANNPMGVHHAWGRTYKDAYNRYFAMTGRELRYQQGFDCQGLWVEVEVEKELGLKNKRDIENLVPGDPEASIDRFVQTCKDRVNKFARVQTEQSIRLGYWMNWDRTDAEWAKSPDERKSYFTMAEANNYTIWGFLKKCFGKGMVYRGYDVMPWCGRCGVGLSEMEMKEGYRLVEHKSVFVKFPLKDRPGENLLVWTTTPWTLTSNVGAAVNPDLNYLKVKLKGEIYYVASGAFRLNRMEKLGFLEEDTGEASGKKGNREWLDGVPHLSSIEQHFKAKAGKGDTYEIIGEVKGADMLGWEYAGPFDDLPAQQHEYGFPDEVARITKQSGKWPARTAAASHRVISGGKDVTETEGTGIVHTAPGCGQIDYQWGKEHGLPPVAPIDDAGNFHDGFGTLTGKNAVDPATADAVFDELKARDRLFATERYVHRYPHCWRCKTELLYRLVDEWFIGMGPKQTDEGFRGDIMKVVDRVTFLPESINGRARERDWLRNMGDWMISKNRYWGLALPIWVDENDPTDFEVIGSRAELRERAVEGWAEFDGHTPHRPWIDRVKIRNPRTGNLMSRVPDVGNPWLDAGIVAFSTLGYHTDPAYWRKWYPADFITESFPGQFRNWFYALLAMSTMTGDGEPPFRTLLGHGLVRDEHGKEMHKSAGNSIEFNRAAEEMGADAMRWLYCRSNPASNLNFGPGPINEVRAKFVLKLWNCYGFFANYARLDGFDPTLPQVPPRDRADIDRWLLSDLQLLIGKARAGFEAFDVMGVCLAVEEFVDAKLSNWYIRRNRDRFWSKATELDAAGRADKLAAYQTLHTVLLDLCRLCAPVVPFLTEVMWSNLRAGTTTESVHLTDYPTANETLIDEELSHDMDVAMLVVSLGNAARNLAKMKVRQPLAELLVATPGWIDNQGVHSGDTERRAVLRFSDLMADELNVKKVTHHNEEARGKLLEIQPRTIAKILAPKHGENYKYVKACIEGHDPVIRKQVTALLFGSLESVDLQVPEMGLVTIYKTEIDLKFDQSKAEFFAVPGKGLRVSVDARLTPELKAEGTARDVVRAVQDERKKAGLDVADKIALYLGTESESLAAAIAAHRPTIAAETQAVEWADTPLDGDAHAAGVKVDGQPLAIALRKV